MKFISLGPRTADPRARANLYYFLIPAGVTGPDIASQERVEILLVTWLNVITIYEWWESLPRNRKRKTDIAATNGGDFSSFSWNLAQ